MHPLDVADHVAAEVDELRDRAGRLPAEDRPRLIDLTNDLDLYLTFGARRWTSATTAATSPILLPGGGRMSTRMNIPIVGSASARELVLRAGCRDFDSQPPIVELVDEGHRRLSPAAWPTDPTGRGIVSNHRKYQRPFFCRPGTREYHEHPQHENDHWDRHREGTSLWSILLPIMRDLQYRWVL